MHNKWMQQSENQGNDLYVAIVDDYVRTFMQMVQYHQFLKRYNPRTSLGKEEYMLRIAQKYAQCIQNPKGLNDAMVSVPVANEYCIGDPYFEGEEVFGSQNRMPNLP